MDLKKFSIFRKIFSLTVVFVFFAAVPARLFAQEEVTTITINNARQTTYTKDTESNNDVIVLEGSVDLEVQKGETVSKIKADKITYDRKLEMLYASGNVEILTKSSASGGETTTASSLLMNTGTLEGIFDDGRVVQTQSDALNLPSGSTLIVFADIFGKGKENTIAFKNSSLTFCDDENPHWHINATRTWLLPGGEFAFFNALLYVGSIPVLYFPAFYYPKDELVFNPVFGYRKREGYYVNNTLYLYGRKPLDSTDTSSTSSDSTSAESLKSLYNFMKPSSLKEQKLEGLVLHNLETEYTGNTTNYVKLIADFYSNLGYLVGINGNLAPLPKYISTFSFNAYAGMSNTIFNNNGDYFPYSNATGKVYSDESAFMGFKIPFRYAGKFDFALSKPFTLKISLPIYSDPFFAYDFLDNRSETMEWISYLLDSTSADSQDVDITEVSSFSWTASASVSPSIPEVLKPYITSFSFSANTSVLLSSMNATFTFTPTNGSTQYYYDTGKYESDWTEVTPFRKFYYPSQITPLSASGNISGTLFQWPMEKKTSKSSAAQKYVIDLNKPEELKTQKELIAQNIKSEDDKNEEDSAEKTESIEELDEEFEFLQPTLPDLTFTATTESLAEGFNYKLSYSIAPNVSTTLAYSSTNLKIAEDFDWKNIRSYMYTVKVPTTLNSAFSYGGNFFGVSNNISYSPVFQKHPYISVDEPNGGYKQSEADSLVLADYKAESQTVSTSNTVSFMPFTHASYFSETGVKWNSNIKLYRQEFIGDIDNPEWQKFNFDASDENCITVNSLDIILGASQFNKKCKETLTFTSVMPPLLRRYSLNLNLVFPYISTNIGAGYSETTHDEVAAEDKWKLDPLQQSLTVSLLNNSLKFTESYNYNLDESHHESMKVSASWNSLQLSYVMSYTYGYDFDETTGWNVKKEKQFLPYSLTFSHSPSKKTIYRWNNRIVMSAGASTNVVADLLRPTNSYLTFTPSISFKIHEFFDLTFSSSSKNSVLYRYFQTMMGVPGRIPGEENPFLDLIDSFRFDNEAKRLGSGYKLKSMDMTMSHNLHDWSFNLTYKVQPELVYKTSEKKYVYDITPSVSVGVVWNPMESIKTKLKYDYDKTEETGIWSME